MAQNIHGDKDSPIHYASRLLNSAEKNYSTTERKALAMVYSVGKFRHYLLANHFVFYVDHQTLIYLVIRPIVSRCIAGWMLLLQEYNFEVVYKPGISHVMADHLSRIKSGEEPQGCKISSRMRACSWYMCNLSKIGKHFLLSTLHTENYCPY